MRTSIFLFLSSLMMVGCGGSEEGSTVATDTGAATTETSTTDDTGSATTDTGTATEDTGTTIEETGADTMMAGDTMMGGDTKVDAPADTAGAATFTQVYAILKAKCGGCHTTSTAGNLDLKDKATAYGELVGKKAEGGACSGGMAMTRVVAGDAENSLLIHKLTKTAVCGKPMPEGRAALPAAEIATIRSWINGGAKND